MTTPIAADTAQTHNTDTSAHQQRLRRELWWAGAALIAGFLVLPMLIYAVGVLLLGEYGGGEGLGAFYGDLYRALGTASLAAWSIVLGPMLFTCLVRIVLIPWPHLLPAAQHPAADSMRESAQPLKTATRREPFVGG